MKINNYDTVLDELKPCPFCGKNPIAFLVGNDYKKKRVITIKCKNCNVEMCQATLHNSTDWLEKSMIYRWNTRFDEMDVLTKQEESEGK